MKIKEILQEVTKKKCWGGKNNDSQRHPLGVSAGHCRRTSNVITFTFLGVSGDD